MSTNLARGKWVEAVEAEYKEVLAKRAEEKAQEDEREAGASRARAHTAMGASGD